jgi:hypothetical protein
MTESPARVISSERSLREALAVGQKRSWRNGLFIQTEI